MHSINILLYILFFTFPAYSQLPEFKTKQDIHKIRYISPKGTYTFYQKTSGELQLSTNYNFKNIFQASKGSDYQVSGSKENSQIVFTVNDSPLSKINFNKEFKIYSSDIKGEKQPQELGTGVDPKLHLQDQMVSFYSPKENKLKIVNLFDLSLKKEIKLQKKHAFWRPLHFVITPNDVVYTDINKNNHEAVLMYSFIENSFKTIYKTSVNSNKLEACLLKDNIIIGEYSLTNYKSPSRIYSIPLYNNYNFNTKDLLYSNSFSDLGQLICFKDAIYFIKTVAFNEKLNLPKTEIVKLNFKTKKITSIVANNNYQQLIQIGDFILTYYRDKYYLVEGPNDLIKDAIKKDRENK